LWGVFGYDVELGVEEAGAVVGAAVDAAAGALDVVSLEVEAVLVSAGAAALADSDDFSEPDSAAGSLLLAA
jgi:hypothetical protein